jgi:hypothetical protein
VGTILQILEKHSINIGMSPVTLLDYPLDRERLLVSANRARLHAQAYQDWRNNQAMDFWQIAQYSDEYIEQIQNDLEISGKPRFYWAAANCVIPTHIDYNTQCAVNFVLSDSPAPVTFRTREYLYTQAVLNTAQPHSVINGPIERILFKISIFDESYESLVARIPYKKILE